ncbi:MAG: Uncharacterized protein CEO21_124 [Microgenomates group bacterium Gr01-1014_80]|nr:MAG: Uncharacterized protein CEO21_124 [Microgenomates group bacterium Gr01-1014_80]
MKIQLPNRKGFTLIELLVVITILSVLAVIAFAAFRGLTGRGNDARRQADIKAIADAVEVARGQNSAYQTLTVNAFSGGFAPQEPARTAVNLPKYCYTDGTAVINNPAVWSITDCPAAGSGNGTAWMTVNNSQLPTVSATATFFKVCTVNEALAAVICYGSRQ